MSDVLIKAEHVSKKFCRSLKRSLWYGVKDVAHSLNPWAQDANVSTTEDTRSRQLRQDEFWALQDISFEVRRGECLGLIGHNGAGKSTLLKILNNLIRPDSGRISMRGRVGAMIELGAGFNPILTGRENIYNQAALLGFSSIEVRSKFDAIVEFSELSAFLDMPLQNYSSGMKVRLGFSVYSQLNPDILIIDEVLAVGDVAFRFKCLNAVGEMMKSTAVIFVSHAMPQVFRICTGLMVLDRGRSTYQGTDLAAGVGTYMQLMKGGEGTVTGSLEAVVSSVQLSSEDASVAIGGTLETWHGNEFILEAGLRALATITEARCEVLLWNSEMVPVMELMTEGLTGLLFQFSESGESLIRTRLPRLELGPGKYSVSIVITNIDHSRVYCRHDNVAFVDVKTDSPSGAAVLAVAEWQLKSLGPLTA